MIFIMKESFINAYDVWHKNNNNFLKHPDYGHVIVVNQLKCFLYIMYCMYA